MVGVDVQDVRVHLAGAQVALRESVRKLGERRKEEKKERTEHREETQGNYSREKKVDRRTSAKNREKKDQKRNRKKRGNAAVFVLTCVYRLTSKHAKSASSDVNLNSRAGVGCARQKSRPV